MASLREILDLPDGGVISIVGGGGKTTLLFALAREIAAAGQTVLTTTTTKIRVPSAEQSPGLIISPHPQEILAQARLLPRGQRHVTAAGTLLAAEKKLAGLTPEAVAALHQGGLFRWILVEADGARGRPLKAPAAHEPVVPSCSHALIALIGLDALGRPLTEEWVFRSRLYGQITGLSPGEVITERSVAAALTHAGGIMKGAPAGAARIVFLNKADTEDRRAAGRSVADLLETGAGPMKPDRVVIGSLRQGTISPGRRPIVDDRGDSGAAVPAGAPTAGIVLAAGMSRRMEQGTLPKLVLDLGGKPLLAWTLEAALQSQLGEIILVLGHEAERVRAALGPRAEDRRLRIVTNGDYRGGMASSLQAGLQRVKDRFPSVMFLLGDQPLAGTETLDLLLSRFREADKGICVPVCGGRRGNPVIFGSRYYDEILAIRGDTGAREIIDLHPDDVLSVAIADPRFFLDIDRAEDLKTVLPYLEKSP